jgi:TolB-like protein
MRRTPFFSIACFAVLAATCWGGLPITMIAGSSPQTTDPAHPSIVRLMPFHAVGATSDNAWISQAIDEDLAHDLSRNHSIRVVRPATTEPSVPAPNAADTPGSLKADQVISGSYQVVDDQLRITAEVTDQNETQPVGEAKATGRVRDLFQLEDSLATQLWHVLPQPSEPAVASDFQVTPLEDYVASQQNSTAPPTVIYEPAPNDAAASPDYGVAPYTGAYDYPYGPYGYGYGLGFPLFIYGGFGHRGFHGGEHGGHFGGSPAGHSTPHAIGSPAIGAGIGGAREGGGFVGASHFGGGHR